MKVKVCTCNHATEWLIKEIKEGRYPQKFQPDATGAYVLICVKCSALWDHGATDRVIDQIVGTYLKSPEGAARKIGLSVGTGASTMTDTSTAIDATADLDRGVGGDLAVTP